MEQKKTEKGGQPPKRRQSRVALEEYQGKYLQVPKIIDRKPVFISKELRDRIDHVVLFYGKRGMSTSGFIENLLRHHLDTHEEDFKKWRKL